MHLNKICPVCHQSFEARRKDQVYCTYYCRKKHHKETYYSKNRIVEDINDEEDTGVILRQFKCKKCHELLTYSPCLKAGDSWIQTILAY